MKLLWLICLTWLLPTVFGANILALLPMPSKSHSILIERILNHLDEKGHQITYITSNKPSKPMGKTEVIFIDKVKEKIFEGRPEMNGTSNMLMFRGMSPWMQFLFMPSMGLRISDFVLENQQIKELINSDRKYDLIFGEIFLDESLLGGFSKRFNAPIIALQTFMPGVWVNYLTGNPAPASYIPDPFLGFGTKMSLYERVYNFVFSSFGTVHYSAYYLQKQDEIMRKHFGDDFPPLGAILKNTSLVFINHHYSLGFPRPLLPNVIEVAGMHIDKPKPLPKDLQTFMDDSKQGVILFSLGSNIRGADLPPETASAILRAFSRMKQNILWKFETSLDNLPKNVRIEKWLPQSDLLAHPNLKLFITHGGLLSTTEAVVRGVPLVGIPIFGDQPLNMKHTENSGFGKTLQFEDITEDNFYNIVMEVVNNPKYTEAAKTKSALLQDTQSDPLETTRWWIEYVIRHKGAPHLRSAAQDLCWFQLYLFDVYAILAGILAVVIYINIKIFRAIGRKICGKCCTAKTKTDKKKN